MELCVICWEMDTEMVILLEISQTQAHIFVDLRLQKATDVDMKAWVTLDKSSRVVGGKER